MWYILALLQSLLQILLQLHIQQLQSLLPLQLLHTDWFTRAAGTRCGIARRSLGVRRVSWRRRHSVGGRREQRLVIDLGHSGRSQRPHGQTTYTVSTSAQHRTVDN